MDGMIRGKREVLKPYTGLHLWYQFFTHLLPCCKSRGGFALLCWDLAGSAMWVEVWKEEIHLLGEWLQRSSVSLGRREYTEVLSVENDKWKHWLEESDGSILNWVHFIVNDSHFFSSFFWGWHCSRYWMKEEEKGFVGWRSRCSKKRLGPISAGETGGRVWRWWHSFQCVPTLSLSSSLWMPFLSLLPLLTPWASRYQASTVPHPSPFQKYFAQAWTLL